ncbi:MAG: TlpA family protein disulfide reductase [Candidatus Binatia bacterium]
MLFFGVAWRGSEAESLDYIEEFDVPYDSGLDRDESVFSAYGFSYQPATVLVTRSGRIFMSRFGPISEAELAEQIDAVLEQA